MCKGDTIKPVRIATNKKWVLENHPNGIFDPSRDVKSINETYFASCEKLTLDNRNDNGEESILFCQDDEIIVEVDMLSVDAFIRTMLDKKDEAFHGSLKVGDTIPALGFGKIIYKGSAVTKFKVGAAVSGMLGAQTHAKLKATSEFLFPKMDIPLMPPTASLGLTGITTGITAYAGTFYVCRPPKKGETAVVTASAGAVGSIAAQLAKCTGARVVGIAGGEKKKSFLLNEMKLHGAIDYKDPNRTLKEQLSEICPDGIDFVFDNVGGETLDALLEKINPKGRIVICGAVSQYSGNLNVGKVYGPSNYLKLAERGAEMKGFTVMQYMSKILFALFGMFWYYITGKVSMKEHIEEGIESFPGALQKLFTGGHIGKMLVDVKKIKSE